MNKEKRIISNYFKVLILLLVLIIFPTIRADVISLNSGGSNEIIINPDTYIEGFFSCVPDTCLSLVYECGTWADGCGGTLNCGTCASGYTCPAGFCVAEEAPSGNGGEAPTMNIIINPTEISLTLAVNTNKEEIIKVKNLGTSTVSITVSQQSLDNMVILGETSFELAAGQSKDLSVIFVALNQTGTFTGRIIIGNRVVLVSFNVKTKLLLFDSNIIVLNKDYRIEQGDKLRSMVTLIPLGDEDRLDVTLNYVIKDYNNKIYLTKSETVLVEKQINFKRNFDTGQLPLEKYIIGLELVYPGGVAPSSAHFEVVERIILIGEISLYLITAILLILIIIVIFLIIRHLKKKKQQEVSQQQT